MGYNIFEFLDIMVWTLLFAANKNLYYFRYIRFYYKRIAIYLTIHYFNFLQLFIIIENAVIERDKFLNIGLLEQKLHISNFYIYSKIAPNKYANFISCKYNT